MSYCGSVVLQMVQFNVMFSFYRLKIIEEERLKLLKEHAAELIGYFPPGILRETDLAHLNM